MKKGIKVLENGEEKVTEGLLKFTAFTIIFFTGTMAGAVHILKSALEGNFILFLVQLVLTFAFFLPGIYCEKRMSAYISYNHMVLQEYMNKKEEK